MARARLNSLICLLGLVTACTHDLGQISRPCGERGGCPAGQVCGGARCVIPEAGVAQDAGRDADGAHRDQTADLRPDLAPDMGHDLAYDLAYDLALDLTPVDRSSELLVSDQAVKDQAVKDLAAKDLAAKDQTVPDLQTAVDLGPCGNKQLDPGEQCDTPHLKGQTCKSQGYVGGTLACGKGCVLDTSGCHLCGNGVVNAKPKEQCDGQNLNSQDCVKLGYAGGALTCQADCSWSAPSCYKLPDVATAGFQVSAAGVTTSRPRTACAGKTCLVVWEQGLVGKTDLKATLVDTGVSQPAGSAAIPVAVAAGAQTAPDLAHNGHEFLVVWRSAAGHVEGLRVDAAGKRLNTKPIPISPAAGSQSAPALACGGATCLVVWVEALSGGLGSVRGVRVDRWGSAVDKQPLVIAAGTVQAAAEPAVAHGGGAYMVLWTQRVSSGQRDVLGRLVGTGTSPLGQVISVSSPPATADHGAPSVAWSGGNFITLCSRGGTLLSARVSAAGVVQDKPGFKVNLYGGAALRPSVAGGGAGGPLVLWDDSQGVFGTGVSSAGAVLHTRAASSKLPAVQPMVLAPAAGPQLPRSHAAAASSSAGYLVVWQDFRAANQEIFAARTVF